MKMEKRVTSLEKIALPLPSSSIAPALLPALAPSDSLPSAFRSTPIDLPCFSLRFPSLMNMRASVVMPVGSSSDNVEMPKKSALASSKKRRAPGRHISFAPFPTFFSISEKGSSSPATVSACSTKVNYLCGGFDYSLKSTRSRVSELNGFLFCLLSRVEASIVKWRADKECLKSGLQENWSLKAKGSVIQTTSWIWSVCMYRGFFLFSFTCMIQRILLSLRGVSMNR
ncbi:hypothetical protein L7F22_054085 [Adiantum nelumboides]|nr:hypothetical protein [Adiantum nelumboides]